MRERARAEGRTVLYDGTWRERDPRAGARRRAQAGDTPESAARRARR